MTKKIYSLMKMLNLKSVCRRKKKSYIRLISEIIGENVPNREFNGDVFGEKWLTDVREIKYGIDVAQYKNARGNSSDVLNNSKLKKILSL